MNTIVSARPPLSNVAALTLGVAIAILVAVVAQLQVGAHGHRISFKKLPPEAQAIGKENYPEPLSPEQWARIDKVMVSHGGWPGILDLAALTVRKSWIAFALAPLVALALLRWRRGRPRLSTIFGLLGPSLLVVAWAWVVTPNPLLSA